jgi:hypothetical protein
MKNYLRKSTLKGLTADCVRRKIKIIKTVYSQQLNKIMKSKKRGVGTNNLYKPKLVWFDNSVSYEANCFIIVGILDTPSWLLFLIQFLTQTDFSFSSPYTNKVDISLNRKATATRTPARITSVHAILFYNGIRWTCLNVNISFVMLEIKRLAVKLLD